MQLMLQTLMLMLLMLLMPHRRKQIKYSGWTARLKTITPCKITHPAGWSFLRALRTSCPFWSFLKRRIVRSSRPGRLRWVWMAVWARLVSTPQASTTYLTTSRRIHPFCMGSWTESRPPGCLFRRSKQSTLTPFCSPTYNYPRWAACMPLWSIAPCRGMLPCRALWTIPLGT